MRMITPLIIGASLLAFSVVANAADHLYTATHKGHLRNNTGALQTNPAGRGGDLAPGEGNRWRDTLS
jgi:hypothetical protein